MWNSMKKSLQDLDRETLLELVGLERRRSTAQRLVPVFALFGTGILLGVGVGLMLAPRPGRELRHDLRARMGKGKGKEKESPPNLNLDDALENPWPSAPRPSSPHS